MGLLDTAAADATALAPQASFWLFPEFNALPVVASKESFVPLQIRLNTFIFELIIASSGDERKKHPCKVVRAT